MLNIIIIGFVAIVVILLVVAVMQPDQCRVSRSVTISTGPDKIFPEINNLRAFNEWNPWAKMDPDSTQTFEGPETGVGAKMSWQGGPKVGRGSMTNVETRTDEFIKFRMEFLEPFEATQSAEFQLTPDGSDTVVTWSIYGERDFMGKVMGLIFNTEKMIGGPFEQGLCDLKDRVEKTS